MNSDRTWQKVTDIDPQIFDAHEGQYRIRPEFILKIKRMGDMLTIQATGQGQLKFSQGRGRHSFNRQVKAEITFVPDDNGKIPH
ncbi:MAG: hypothetical protein P8K08_01930 [Fuerstiella sp.]|jgi:hypothetical protein|nr:hypothetical protein [Fuerstiella sp.]